MNAWVRAYASHPHMKSVKMVQNGIRQEGISALLQNGLSQCHELELLDLQDNTFTAMGARALADVVAKWPALVELGVGDSLLSARGSVMLADALATGANTKIEILRLQYNEIDAKGLTALAKVAQAGHLPSLRRLEINGNKFSEEDPAIETLKEILDARKEVVATEDNEDDEEAWGIDELDDLEEDSDDEEEDEHDEDDDDEDAEEEKIVKEADAAEAQPVAEDKDSSVDDLAATLGKTEIK